MTLIDAINSLKQFKRPTWSYSIKYFKEQTGPFVYLIDCDYFVVYNEIREPYLITSLDLYPEDILSNEYVVADSFDVER